MNKSSKNEQQKKTPPMVVELYDIIGSLQDASETIVEYDMLERTRWLANDIYKFIFIAD